MRPRPLTRFPIIGWCYLYNRVFAPLLFANLSFVNVMAFDEDEPGVYSTCYELARSVLSAVTVLEAGAFPRLTREFPAGCRAEACSPRVLILLFVPVIASALAHGAGIVARLCGPEYRSITSWPAALLGATCALSVHGASSSPTIGRGSSSPWSSGGR